MRERFREHEIPRAARAQLLRGRPRLHDALDRSRDVRLTSVVASGRLREDRAVASGWRTDLTANTAWLSCDERDTARQRSGGPPSRRWTAGRRPGSTRRPIDDDEPPLHDVAIAFAKRRVRRRTGHARHRRLSRRQERVRVCNVAIHALPPSARLVLVGRTTRCCPCIARERRQELLELREEDLRLLAHETGALATRRSVSA